MKQTSCGLVLVLLFLNLIYAPILSAKEKKKYDFTSIAEYPLTRKRISLYKKYDDMIPLIINDLKACAPLSKDSSGYTSYSRFVADYGKFLEKNGSLDYNDLTVHRADYWKAFFVLAANDATVLFTRMIYLIREGELERAETVFMFARYNANPQWERDSLIDKNVRKDLQDCFNESNRLVKEGITNYDSGEYQEALVKFIKALEIYPKNPWALYEICLVMRTTEKKGEKMFPDVRSDTYHAYIRHLAPFYFHAYQGTMTPEIRKGAIALLNKVQPSYKELWKGNSSSDNLRKFAEGCKDLGEYEFALYAYRLLLIKEFGGTFDKKIITEIGECLEKLGMASVKPFHEQFCKELEKRYRGRSNNKESK